MMHHSKKILLFVQCLEMLLLIIRNIWGKSHLYSNTGITHRIKQQSYTSMKQQNADFTVWPTAMRGLTWSRSSVQNQHIYCMTNRLQKIFKDKVSGLENNAARFLFLKNCVKYHFILQLEKIITWFDTQCTRWIF